MLIATCTAFRASQSCRICFVLALWRSWPLLSSSIALAFLLSSLSTCLSSFTQRRIALRSCLFFFSGLVDLFLVVLLLSIDLW